MCLLNKNKESEPSKIAPLPPKEYQNMQILLEQAIKWREREEVRLEKQTLIQLQEYIDNFTDEKK